MAKSAELIDEKLSELCRQLETLGSIKEKSVALKEVAAKLSSVGDERVRQVQSVLTSFTEKTKEAVGDVENCITRLDKVLWEVSRTPIVEELREIRETVISSLQSIVDGIALMEKKSSDRMDALKQEVANLSMSLSRNSAEVTNIKRNVSNYASQTKDGLSELDTTVRDRTGELDTKFEKGQSRQSSDIKQMRKLISDGITESRTGITDAVADCKKAVESCRCAVRTVHLLAATTLIALVGFIMAMFPFLKVVWERYSK